MLTATNTAKKTTTTKIKKPPSLLNNKIPQRQLQMMSMLYYNELAIRLPWHCQEDNKEPATETIHHHHIHQGSIVGLAAIPSRDKIVHLLLHNDSHTGESGTHNERFSFGLHLLSTKCWWKKRCLASYIASSLPFSTTLSQAILSLARLVRPNVV